MPRHATRLLGRPFFERHNILTLGSVKYYTLGSLSRASRRPKAASASGSCGNHRAICRSSTAHFAQSEEIFRSWIRVRVLRNAGEVLRRTATRGPEVYASSERLGMWWPEVMRATFSYPVLAYSARNTDNQSWMAT